MFIALYTRMRLAGDPNARRAQARHALVDSGVTRGRLELRGKKPKCASAIPRFAEIPIPIVVEISATLRGIPMPSEDRTTCGETFKPV